MKYQGSEVSLRKAIRLGFSIIVLIVAPAATVLAQNGGLYVYPAKGQSQGQQQKDRYECHSWAVQQTGVDPSRSETMAAPPSSSSSQQYQPSKPHVLQGAGRGAALGAVGGAIAGDAGKGAAAGAAMGGGVGAFRRRDEKKQQAAQQQANAQAAQQSRLTSYNRAMAACLQGRGYTVN
jgi:hypothetical protein